MTNTITLRAYQQELLDRIREATRKYKGICVVLPCGGGKTVIFADIARTAAIKRKRVLIISPMDTIEAQIIDTLKTLSVEMDLVEVVSYKKACTKAWLAKYDSDYFTSIIVDEAHHSCASSYKTIFEHFKDVYRFGFTATPERLDGKPMSDAYQVLVEGPTAKTLIAEGHLCASQVVSNDSVRKNYKRKTSKSLDYTSRELGNMDLGASYLEVVHAYATVVKNGQAIAYCPNVEFSKKQALACKQSGIPAVHLDASVPKAARTQAVEDFKSGKIKVICNVNLVGEGFDVPACEAVLMLRPTLSRTMYVQQAMRCMRVSPGKKVGIVLDFVENSRLHGEPESDYEYSLDGHETQAVREDTVREAGEPEPKEVDKDRIASVFALLASDERDIHFGEQLLRRLESARDVYEFLTYTKRMTGGKRPVSKICGAFIKTARRSGLFKTEDDWSQLGEVFHYSPSWAAYQAGTR